jgi:hypothetical protein
MLFDGWRAEAVIRRGWTRFGAGSFSTSAYLLELFKEGVWQGNDQVTLRFSQPLVIEKGGFRMTLPVYYDYLSRGASLDERELSLAPNRREFSAEAGYARTLRRGVLNINVFGRLHPGHSSDSSADVGGVIRFAVPM